MDSHNKMDKRLLGDMELRCLSCICAGCAIEYTCKEKPCDDTTNPHECIYVQCQCDIYDEMYDNDE